MKLFLFILSAITLQASSLQVANSPIKTSANQKNEQDKTPFLLFPGGGIFFYWQAGAVTYLREQGYDLSKARLGGASAGALTATLAAGEVDFYEAMELALSLAEKAGVWERRQGLQGIWGPMIDTWLDDLIPEDILTMVDGRLSLLVTQIPSFRKANINSFISRKDLISCNMASVHLVRLK